MTSHAILNPNDHKDIRVQTRHQADLGDGVMACFTVPVEFRRIQGEFPILFRRDLETGQFSALALLGFEAGENLFLSDGHWDASYKPLALAVQPFLVGRPAEGDGPGQVHIDMAHPRVLTGGDEGVRLFDDDGNPSPFIDEMASSLGMLDEGYRQSADFFAALDRYELLEPFSLDVTMDDGQQQRLVGYHMVNEDRLRTLEPGALAELHAAGHLMPLFMAVASVGNLAKLVRRKNQRLHG